MSATADSTEAIGLIRGTAGGFMTSQALYAAARLRVADALADGPLHADQLAAKLQAKEESLRRVLRMLAAHGIFRELEPGVFENNAASSLLRQEGDEPSERDVVMHLGHESYRAWAHLADSLLLLHPTGQAFHDFSDGKDFFEWLSDHKEAEERFDHAMTINTAYGLPAILKDYDWGQHAHATVADVGGGEGMVLSALLAQHPGMRGVLFDRPPTIATASKLWPVQHADLLDRCELVGGDFFVQAPAANVYFLKYILHDWSDERAAAILRTLRAAAPPGARLLLCELVMAEEPKEVVPFIAAMDVHMMAVAGGKERTVTQWRGVMAAGGWELDCVVPLSNGHSMVVGK